MYFGPAHCRVVLSSYLSLFDNGIFHGEDEDTGDKDSIVSTLLGKVTSTPLGLKLQDDDKIYLGS